MLTPNLLLPHKFTATKLPNKRSPVILHCELAQTPSSTFSSIAYNKHHTLGATLRISAHLLPKRPSGSPTLHPISAR